MGGGPVASGGIRIRDLADGTRAFELRFMADGKRDAVTLHERAACECGCGGGWSERAVRRELGNMQARVRAGVRVGRGTARSSTRCRADAPPSVSATRARRRWQWRRPAVRSCFTSSGSASH